MKQKTFFRNLRLVCGTIWKKDRSFFSKQTVYILTMVLIPFLEAALPSFVIWLLEKGTGLGSLAGGIAAVFLASGIAAGFGRCYQQVAQGQISDIRMKHFDSQYFLKCLTIDLQKYESPAIRELQGKAMSCAQDGDSTMGFTGYLTSWGNVLIGFSGIVLYACIASGIHPLIVVLLTAIALIQIGATHLAQKCEIRQRGEKSQLRIQQNYIGKQAFENGTGKDIRLYRLGGWLESTYSKLNRKLQKLLRKEYGANFLADLAGIALQFLRDAVCYGYLLFLTSKGMPPAQFVLYLGIISGFGSWFTILGDGISVLMRCSNQISDFYSYLNVPSDFLHKEGAALPENGAFDVEFSHVSFAYPGSRKILDDVSFHIHPGEKVALIGNNGAGKSTTVKLMCGFYKPTSGKILINGTDLNTLNIDWYMKRIAAVFQKSLALSFPIAENVSCKVPEETDVARCEEMLKLAGLWEKIDSLPKKAGTYLNKDMQNDGVSLSGGEAQKLMLARALYKNPSLLLLDEPTAALDAIAESKMYQLYGKLLQGKSALFISHRLASTRFCSRILLLNNGKIAEEGTHDELMQKGGLYRKMFDVQSKYYKEGTSHETA